MDNHLERLRNEEIKLINNYFNPGINVLEIGGGSGYQASIIKSQGCNVVSIDVSDIPGYTGKYYPVSIYDGETLPFKNGQFNIVFSSNVMEHIKSLPSMFNEIKRVLKENGKAIHIVPSTSWRLWTIATYYIFLFKYLLGFIKNNNRSNKSRSSKKKNFFYYLRRLFIDQPHGEYSSAISELYYFSNKRWLNVFLGNGFKIIEYKKNGIFYTGHVIYPNMSIVLRKKLSKIFGSSCNVYVMRKKEK